MLAGKNHTGNQNSAMAANNERTPKTAAPCTPRDLQQQALVKRILGTWSISAFDWSRLGFPATFLAEAVDVEALPSQREPCLCSNSCNHFLSDRVIYVADVSTSSTNQVCVRLHIGIESCLTFCERQLLN
jgi:hypothetical protein